MQKITSIPIRIIGSHPLAGHRGTIAVVDGLPVREAPDGIGRADRIRVELAGGGEAWVKREWWDYRVIGDDE